MIENYTDDSSERPGENAYNDSEPISGTPTKTADGNHDAAGATHTAESSSLTADPQSNAPQGDSSYAGMCLFVCLLSVMLVVYG